MLWDARGSSAVAVILAAIFGSVILQVAEANGQFQVQILAMDRLRSSGVHPDNNAVHPDNNCCRFPDQPEVADVTSMNRTAAVATATPVPSSCSHICRPYIRLCFKQYQRNVVLGAAQDCILEGLSPVLVLPTPTPPTAAGAKGNNTTESGIVTINLPFTFGWMKSYTMIVELLDARGIRANRSVDRLIEQGVQSTEISPGPMWHQFKHTGNTVALTYQLRVLCDEFYGNVTCSTYCRPRNDHFGHWYCNEESQTVCLDGWTGPQCEKAICSSTCQNGTCQLPGECRCRSGWKGENCDQCVAHVACKHGKCNTKPWECVCELGWGGPMCDQDMNYCGRNSPCYNYAVCHNTNGPDFYECRCPEGFSGSDCSQVIDPCELDFVCQNGGQCFANNGTAQCRCASGWSGAKCDNDINECASGPCKNGATCVDDVAKYQCICQEGFGGVDCVDDVRPRQLPEITKTNLLQGAERVINASKDQITGLGLQLEAAAGKSTRDDSTLIITVVLSILLILAVLCCVLLSLFFYRRRQKLRRSLEDSVANDKYGCGTSNNRQQTKDLLHHRKVSDGAGDDIHIIRCNQENEARLKILNNIFTPETRLSSISSCDCEEMSEKSDDSLRKMNLKSASPPASTDSSHVRYVNHEASSQHHDPYWNNRDRPTLYASKDHKNSYMESVRRGMLDGRKSSASLSSSTAATATTGKCGELEDFTVV
ncbi:Protein jagged-1a [Hypsibius exemplaris]|uniref:Delta-like protein n=1 Tax=Hypsibius exemplaris TaxID=2072580 RepID=A0A1W0WSD4_HYPEX|nr:Protein jagged-1a [Hypsibius exemplaris]